MTAIDAFGLMDMRARSIRARRAAATKGFAGGSAESPWLMGEVRRMICPHGRSAVCLTNAAACGICCGLRLLSEEICV